MMHNIEVIIWYLHPIYDHMSYNHTLQGTAHCTGTKGGVFGFKPETVHRMGKEIYVSFTGY